MDIGSILKQLRQSNNYSQAQLAEMIHVKTSVISRWERGDNNPNLEVSIKLAKALNVSMDVFCGNNSIKGSELENLAQKASTLPKEQVKALKMVLKSFLK